MLNLPSRRSSSVIFICETFAPGDLAYSLPSEYYIATYLVWSHAADDEKHRSWLKQAYKGVAQVSCGIYVADFDADMRMTKVDSSKCNLLIIDHDRQSLGKVGGNKREMGSKSTNWRIPREIENECTRQITRISKWNIKTPIKL